MDFSWRSPSVKTSCRDAISDFLLAKQLSELQVQHCRKIAQYAERWIRNSTLNLTCICPVNADLMCKLFLRESESVPALFYDTSELLSDDLLL